MWANIILMIILFDSRVLWIIILPILVKMMVVMWTTLCYVLLVQVVVGEKLNGKIETDEVRGNVPSFYKTIRATKTIREKYLQSFRFN